MAASSADRFLPVWASTSWMNAPMRPARAPGVGAESMSSTFTQSACASCGVSENRVLRLHKLAPVTMTVKLAEALPLLPATSVALADTVFVPRGKAYAGACTSLQVLDATPERLSAAVQVMST